MVAATLFAVAACSAGDDASDTAGAVTTSAGGDVATSPSPAIVMGYLATVNSHEVEAGDLALDKATDARVREYARMMVADHGRALRESGSAGDSAAMAAPVGQPAVDAQVMHEQAMMTLRTTDKGRPFDSAYIAMMITGHQAVLARLEGMKGTGNSASATPATGVHTHLQSSIEMVRTHLQRAQEVQQSLQGGR